MSFQGYYQQVCVNGHYCESDVYARHEKCIDCHLDIIFENLVDQTNGDNVGYMRIPTNKAGDVDKNFFDKYLSSKEKIKKLEERNKALVSEYQINFFKNEYKLEKIIELFKYFNNKKTLKIQFSMKRDQGDNLVPFVFVSFGQFDTDSKEWKPLYIDDYCQETTEGNGYECCLWYYDTDVRTAVIQLYNNMWKRLFDQNFKNQE